MSTRITEHLRSNVVGYVAIFLFAIGGTAYATHPGGANTISTVDIINGEVKTADVGTGEVGSADIANDGVATIDIADDAITQNKIIAGGVRTSEIANNQVLSADIGPAAVGFDDLNLSAFFAGDIGNTGFGDIEIPDNAIQSNEINDGAVGGADLSVLTRLGPDTTIPDDGGTGLTILEAECDPGEKALGGGASNFGATGVYMTQSVPLPDTGGEEVPTGWRVTVENQSGSEQSGSAWAICTQAGATGESPGGGRN